MRTLLRLLLCLTLCSALTEAWGAERTASRDTLRDSRQKLSLADAAVVEDAQQPSRVCNSRPSRLLPSPVFQPKRQAAAPIARTQTSHLTSFLTYGSRRTLKPPFRTVASCDYYVIALRHILR